MTTAAAADGSTHAKGHSNGMFMDFAPWLVYWCLIGNSSFRTALLLAFAVSAWVIGRSVLNGQRPKILEIGTFATFIVLVILAFTASDSFLQQWIQPITNGAIFLIALISVLIGRPFTLEYARESVTSEVAAKPGFMKVTRTIGWVWVLAFFVMTVSAFIPPLVEGSASIKDAGDTTSVIGYWIIPIGSLAAAILFTKWYPDFYARQKANEHAGQPAL